jgi:hypothetical protein
MSSTTTNAATLRRIVAASGLLLLISATAVPQVFADQTFHTERVALTSANAAPLHSGFVVDIHANGQPVFALERYVLVGAAPDSAYRVDLLVFSTNSTCSGAPFPVPETRLQTNAAGDGEAGIVLTPADIPQSLHHTTISVIWQVVNLATGAADYQTGCVVVSID